jgi:hypothetical protein
MATARECAVCPATTNLKACSRCRETLYFSAEHAKLVSSIRRLPEQLFPFASALQLTYLTYLAGLLQLWPHHKKYCATGVEIWYEEDLSEKEINRLTHPVEEGESLTSAPAVQILNLSSS